VSSYKLSYFDFDGGRGEPIRIAMQAAGIAFDDERLSFQQFSERRNGLRFNAVPVLEIDGEQVTQSDAIARYVGKLGGLYPDDALQAMYCDEVLGALEDLTHYVVQTFGLEGDALKEARLKLVDGRMSVFLRGLEALLIRGGGSFFAGDALSIADLKAFVQTRGLESGNMDHVPTDIVERVAPLLLEHRQRVGDDPRVVAYYASRS